MATKKDLIEALQRNLSYLNMEDAELAVNSTLDYLKKELCKMNRIEIRGFGSISVREKKFVGQSKKYKTIYFRMSKNVQDILK